MSYEIKPTFLSSLIDTVNSSSNTVINIESVNGIDTDHDTYNFSRFEIKDRVDDRDFIFAKIDVMTLKTIISDINKGDTSVRSLKVFVTDSQGLTAQAKAKAVRKQLHYHLEKDRIEILIKVKEQKRRVKADEALVKQQKKIERTVHRKEMLGKMLLKIQGIFRRKAK